MKHDQNFTGQEFAVVGTRVRRPDGFEKVTGSARYGADTSAAGQLVGLVLRSPHAHARINSIDTRAAQALAGVKAVLTSDDLPDLSGGDRAQLDILENCMARGRALYDGHAVAAVAAIDMTVARRALQLIVVDYEVLPHVTDVDAAMEPGAPIVHQHIRTAGLQPPSDLPTNICQRGEHGHGDVEAGFQAADVIVENHYKTEQVHQGYIEPHACLANVNADGTAQMWVTTQGHFVFRNVCAALLGLDVAKLRVTPSEIGGGFGGKTHVWIEPLALALSRKASRPVKMTMSRDEIFRATGPTSSSSIDIRIGAKRDGTITAADATLRYHSGAFPSMWAQVGAMVAFACYELENVRSVAYDVLCNRPKVAPYRAPGAPMAVFAVESTMDMLADKLAMDRLQLRQLNATREGARASYGPTFGTVSLGEVLETVKNHPHMQAPLEENQGRGVACAYWFPQGGQTCCDLNIDIDGTVSLAIGTIDVGGSRASMALMAAEELGIPYEQVSCEVADSAALGFNDMTDGSRGTFSTGMAAIFAAREAIAVLRQRAALQWGIEVEGVVWQQGHACAPERDDLAPLSLAQIAAAAVTTGGPIAGHSASVADRAGDTFAAHICDVEVDPETGGTRVLRYTVVQDAGRAVHPDYVEGQFQGGAAQGIGWALNEESIYGADGRLQNAGFLDYRMPVCSDLPFIDTVILEIPNPNHPYGVRGVGELPIAPPLAAVGNAIADATGVRMTHAPMSPPRVLKALQEATDRSAPGRAVSSSQRENIL